MIKYLVNVMRKNGAFVSREVKIKGRFGITNRETISMLEVGGVHMDVTIITDWRGKLKAVTLKRGTQWR